MKKNDGLFFTINSFKEKVFDKIDEKNKPSKEYSVNSKILDDLSRTIENNIKMANEAIKDLEENQSFNSNIKKTDITIENKDTTVKNSHIENQKSNTDMKSELKDKKSELPENLEKPTVSLLTKDKIRNLKASLQARVFGQDPVIEEVVDVLKVSALNIKINKDKPAGNYLFAGPSGVGKTELAQTLADSLGVPILVVNMGEYGLEQDVTKLIGSSPGYVGYEEGGILTNFIIENPSCIVLFDELEKAHRSFDKILLSIMDKGVATDNKGVSVKFKDTIIISTSNLGADIEYVQGIEQAEKNAYRMDAIKQGLRPEIINRYDSVFHFNSLSNDVYKKVVNKFLTTLKTGMQEEHKINLYFSEKIVDFIVSKSFDPAMGGRPARRFIEKIVIKPLADYMLDEDFEKEAIKNPDITLDLNKKENICFKGKNKKILGVLENTSELVSRIEEGKFTNKKATL